MAIDAHGGAPEPGGGSVRVADARDWPLRLSALLHEGAPARIALVGGRAAALLAEADAAPGGEGSSGMSGEANAASGAAFGRGDGHRLRFDSLEECARAAPEARRADVALLALDTLDGLDRTLGTACRLYPSRLLLFVEGESVPPAERLFAFGFRRLASGGGAALHEYRLRDYKQPPEWLNARFWANPERFDADEDELDDTGSAEGEIDEDVADDDE